MPKEFPRSRRIGEQVLRVLSTMLRREMNDPRLADVSLTDVELSRDLRHARVYFSVLHPDTDPAPAGEALNRAAGRMRHHLSEQLTTRSTPELKFFYDEALDRGIRLTSLIDRVNSSASGSGDGS
ncbi:MAG: 30S ribosome-binding factor RbfA [Pseudomonadota bacterium]